MEMVLEKCSDFHTVFTLRKLWIQLLKIFNISWTAAVTESTDMTKASVDG